MAPDQKFRAHASSTCRCAPRTWYTIHQRDGRDSRVGDARGAHRISTGSTPRHDGILGFSWAQNDNDYSLFNPTVVRSGAMEHIMSNAGARTLAGLYKNRFPGARVVALSGHKYYAADPLGGPRADAILYYATTPQGRYAPVAIPGHTPPASVLNAPGLNAPGHLAMGQEDHLTAELALSAFKVMRPRMLLINVPEFDWPLGHVLGGNLDNSGVIALMKGFDCRPRHDRDRLSQSRHPEETLFVITSDHGMLPVSHFNSSDYSTTPSPMPALGRRPSPTTRARISGSATTSRARTVAANLGSENIPGFEAAYYLVGSAEITPTTTSRHRRTLPGDLNQPTDRLLSTLLNGHQPSIVLLLHGRVFGIERRLPLEGGSWRRHVAIAARATDLFRARRISRRSDITAPAQLEDIAPTDPRRYGRATEWNARTYPHRRTDHLECPRSTEPRVGDDGR